MPRAAKKRPGRPYLTIKDIPDRFFTYYDAYRYGFWDKQDFAFFLRISKFRLDHYLRIIEDKGPLISCEENKNRRIQLDIPKDDIEKMCEFYCTLKKEQGEVFDESKLFTHAFSARFHWEILKREQARLDKEKKNVLPDEKGDSDKHLKKF